MKTLDTAILTVWNVAKLPILLVASIAWGLVMILANAANQVDWAIVAGTVASAIVLIAKMPIAIVKIAAFVTLFISGLAEISL